MICQHADLGNGNHAIICGVRKPRCKFCARLSTKQCDFEIRSGKTCDLYMCDGCTEKLGPDRDYCPKHRALPKAIADWPATWRELYEERAGVMEFAGNLSRNEAEEAAEIDTRNTASKGELCARTPSR